MAKKTVEYDNQSITSLKGADRVRKRPAVIFGSDGIEGCEHSFFEIISNSVDEFREGYGNRINVTVYNDRTMEVEDFGRGVPLDWNEKENAITGNTYSVNFTPAVNTTTPTAAFMSIRSVLTVWAPARRSTLPNLWKSHPISAERSFL